MNTSFLDYYKMILEKVSFDRALFMKEYSKALRNLNTTETETLNAWLAARGMIHVPSKPYAAGPDRTYIESRKTSLP